MARREVARARWITAPVLQGMEVVRLRQPLAPGAVELQRLGRFVIRALHDTGLDQVDGGIGKVRFPEARCLAVVKEELGRGSIDALTHGPQTLVAGGIWIGDRRVRGRCARRRGGWRRGGWRRRVLRGQMRGQADDGNGQRDRQRPAGPEGGARAGRDGIGIQHTGSGLTGAPDSRSGGEAVQDRARLRANVAPASAMYSASPSAHQGRSGEPLWRPTRPPGRGAGLNSCPAGLRSAAGFLPSGPANRGLGLPGERLWRRASSISSRRFTTM